MKVTSTINAYLTNTTYRQEGFMRAAQAGDHKGVIANLSYCATEGMEEQGWVKVGEASITIEIIDEDAIRLGFVESLKEKKAKILANAQFEAMRIDEQIQNLLAITYEAMS